MEYGVYVITNQNNGRQYVGWTSKVGDERWQTHCRNARKGRTNALYASIRKHGPEAFSFERVYEASSPAEAKMVEKALIAERGSMVPRGYNHTLGGDGVVGRRASPEERAARSLRIKALYAETDLRDKIRLALLGRPRSEAVKKSIGDKNRGKRHTPESLIKCSLASRGRKHDAASRQKMSIAALSRTFTPEHRANISKAKRGKKMHPNAREALRLANVGRVFTPERNLKISIANTGRKHTEQTRERLRVLATKTHAELRIARELLQVLDHASRAA